MNRRVWLVGLLLGLVVGCGDDAAGGSGGAGAAGGSAGSSSDGGSAGSGGTEATGGAGVGAANAAGGSSGEGGSQPGPGSAGCGTAHEPGFTCFDETFEGNARSFCVEVPQSFDPSVQRRIVLGLHGCGGSPQGARSNTAPQVTAGESDLLFVYPKALASCWDYNMTAIDVSYVQHVLDRIAGEYCIDESRTFADGMSSGAMMSSRLLCDGIVDGAAAISLNYSCGTPHPVWLYGGTADEYTPVTYCPAATVGSRPTAARTKRCPCRKGLASSIKAAANEPSGAVTTAATFGPPTRGRRKSSIFFERCELADHLPALGSPP